MLSRFHRKIGSIMELLAILMATLAPTVSQALAASRGEKTVSGAHCFMPSMRDHVPDIKSGPHPLMSDGQACGDCGLLAHMSDKRLSPSRFGQSRTNSVIRTSVPAGREREARHSQYATPRRKCVREGESK
jgi:hypothetical protein